MADRIVDHLVGMVQRIVRRPHRLLGQHQLIETGVLGRTLGWLPRDWIVLDEEFIRTARAKGLSERSVVWSHALRNALAPLIQTLGLSLPVLLSGALVVEVVFSWPGMGQLTFQSILSRDYPVILAATALTAVLVVLGNLFADVAQAWADPTVRYGK